MSFVPISGPARLLSGDLPRESFVEFSNDQRKIVLSIRASLPVLRKATTADDAHPSVALLAGAVLLATQIIASGRFAPDVEGTRWMPALTEVDEDRIIGLAMSRATDGFDLATAEALARRMVDAVVDSMPKAAPSVKANIVEPPPAVPVPDEEFARRLQERIARVRARGNDERPSVVTIALRVQADEEELIAGSLRLVLQVHLAVNEAHMTDAGVLFTESGPDALHGFSDRARMHAIIALREAAAVWSVLDRLLDLRVPDEITLDTDEILSLLDHGIADLAEAGVTVYWPRYLDRDLTARVELKAKGLGDPTQPAHNDGPQREEPLVEGLFGTNALFSFDWQLALHGQELAEAEMDQLAATTSPIIKIRDNWTVVDTAMIKRARKRMIREVKPVEALAATLTDVVRIADIEHEAVIGASLLKVRDRLRDAGAHELVEVPKTLDATLRAYQRTGLSWLAHLTQLGLGACLADDMGLGKTITLIALHLHRNNGPTLVVCPASLLGNWEAEIRRFAPGVAVRRHHGSARDLTDVRDGFVLTTYGTMRNDAEALAQVPWDLLVADEAQHIKNPRSAAGRAMRTIPGNARVALTGTPVENNLTELWAILDWAIPGLLGSRGAFRKVWAGPIESGLEPTKARQFADLVGPFLLRRRKSDPGIAPELPPKTETDHLLRLTQEQVVLYETFVRDCMRRIEEAEEETRRGLVLKMLTGLKQICNHPAHFLKQANPRLTGRSQKIDLLDELLGTVLAEGGATLIFTQYVAMARLLERHLIAGGVPYEFLHGGTPVRAREQMVASFQQGHTPVFLLSLKAGGTGLNLTAADHVIHLDRWWNPAVEDQATDRAHRIGQSRPVQVHRFITQGTIEERIAQLLTRKRSLADSVLAVGEAALTELSDAELRDLVELRP